MKRIEVMNRAGFFKHKSKMILKIDLSNLKKSEQVRKVVDYFLSIVKQMPNFSIVVLVDYRNLIVSDEIRKEMTRLAEHCNPHFAATAFIALDQSTKELTDSVVSRYDRLNIKVFSDVKKANDWLVTQ